MIRVGRIKYSNGQQVYPSYPGFTPIVVMTKSSQYGELGPYCLKDEEGRIMENLWQFSKVYEVVPETHEVYTQRYPIPVWDHHREEHIKDDAVTPEYWEWRKKGFNAKYPVRYPVGRRNMHTCKFALPYDATDDSERLSYIESRKRTYLPIYTSLVKKEDSFHRLKERLAAGENMLIIEIDGPHQETLPYYVTKYGVDAKFIDRDTMLATDKNLQIMLDDPKHPFGHGYCLAAALLDITLK